MTVRTPEVDVMVMVDVADTMHRADVADVEVTVHTVNIGPTCSIIPVLKSPTNCIIYCS